MSRDQRLWSNGPQADEATTPTDRDDDEGEKATGQLITDKSGTTTCLHAGSGPKYQGRPVVGSASCEQPAAAAEKMPGWRFHTALLRRKASKHSAARVSIATLGAWQCPMSPMRPRPMPPHARPCACSYCICCVAVGRSPLFLGPPLPTALLCTLSIHSLAAVADHTTPHTPTPTPIRPSDAPTRAQHGSAESLRCGLGPPMLLCFVSHAYIHTHTRTHALLL